jgi:hypothetical protein
MRRCALSFFAYIALIFSCRADVINLSCDSVTGGGQPIQILILIDSDKGYVRWQEPAQLQEFKDGRFGRILTRHYTMPFLAGEAPSGKQYVIVNQALIAFGAKGIFEIKIDRSTGMMTGGNGRQFPCAPSRSHSF